MEHVTRPKILESFLKANTHSDLADLYEPNMHTTVIVRSDLGERVEGSGVTWTDGIQKWYSFVVQDEVSRDKGITYDFGHYVEGIGLLGWDWSSGQSKWVAFDFDSVMNHKQGLTDSQIKEVEDSLRAIDWVELRKSTSGKGIHAYVYLDPPVHTANREEHSTLARAILHQLSALCGYNFKDSVDICGGNMWIWHRKMQESNGGLTIIKEGVPFQDAEFSLPDWRNCKKDDSSNPTNQLAKSRTFVGLDRKHKQLITWLEDNSKTWWWDADRNMLITHTLHLKEAHSDLGMRGVFETNTSGTTRQNCFCFPLKNGAWAVRRYGRGVAESPTWDVDSSGFTRCYLNTELSFEAAARMYGAVERPDGYWQIKSFVDFMMVLSSLGHQVTQPDQVISSQCKFKEMQDSRIFVTVALEEDDPASDYFRSQEGWYYEKGAWNKLLQKHTNQNVSEDNATYDEIVRHVITYDYSNDGWMLKSNNEWVQEDYTHVKAFLMSEGLNLKDATSIIGSNIVRPWRKVCIPFAPEYPGDRIWNRGAARLRYESLHEVPTNLSEECPHWWSILEHLGGSIDREVRDQWVLASGAEYLISWIASMIQEPSEPLPYLFFVSREENTGKSIFHEALSEIILGGIARADQALMNKSGFNGELEGAVLCVVEETNLSTCKDARPRIKDWVTSKQILIHRKGKTPYSVPNTTHWVQMSNDFEALPVFEGDTRITVCHVPALKKVIPKPVMLEALREEGAKFITYILNYKVPESNERLRIPAITSSAKTVLALNNRTNIDTFLENTVKPKDGMLVPVPKLLASYNAFVGDSGVLDLAKFIRQIPPNYQRGLYNNVLTFINLGYVEDPRMEEEPVGRYRLMTNGKVTYDRL